MSKVRASTKIELPRFQAMESQQHVGDFINPTSLEQHLEYWNDANIVYLTVLDDDDETAGYIILVVEPDENSVEFRRILIDEECVGIGQDTIRRMESFCAKMLGVNRIWLDVYADNARALHVYEKLGYTRFKSEPVNDRTLHFYQKTLATTGDA